MLRFIWGIIAVLSLSACASAEKYRATLDSWIGRSEREMLMTFGIPDRTYQVDAKTKMVSYIARDTAYYPGSFSTCFGAAGPYSAFGCGHPFPSRIETYYCETIFTLEDNRISRWGHKGNNCRI
jgi:hypothetical protein